MVLLFLAGLLQGLAFDVSRLLSEVDIRWVSTPGPHINRTRLLQRRTVLIVETNGRPASLI